MTTLSNSLFKSFQTTLNNAVRKYLALQSTPTGDKLLTTSLRIPSELKAFYECLAEAESTSINTAIINTLGKVKDQTINEYQKNHTKINEAFDYQLSSLFKIIEANELDYNDLSSLLSWLTNKEVSRSMLMDKEKLADLFDKKVQEKFCKLFGYNYEWLQNNSRNIGYTGSIYENNWYKNVTPFTSSILKTFYADELVKKIRLFFICSDYNVIEKIRENRSFNGAEEITPILEVKRNVAGIPIKTNYAFEANDISYSKCQSHFLVLIKIVMMLSELGLISKPYGYCFSREAHEKLRYGKIHPNELFNGLHTYSPFFLDDLESAKHPSYSSNKDNYTDAPDLYHILSKHVLDDILLHGSKSSHEDKKILLDEKLLSRIKGSVGFDTATSQESIIKYLMLYEKPCKHAPNSFIYTLSDEEPYLSIERVKLLSERFNDLKKLETCFG